MMVDGRCQLPYVEVKNYVTSNETNHYCQQVETYIVLQSPGSQLYVSYTRNTSNSGKTFTASYTSIHKTSALALQIVTFFCCLSAL